MRKRTRDNQDLLAREQESNADPAFGCHQPQSVLILIVCFLGERPTEVVDNSVDRRHSHNAAWHPFFSCIAYPKIKHRANFRYEYCRPVLRDKTTPCRRKLTTMAFCIWTCVTAHLHPSSGTLSPPSPAGELYACHPLTTSSRGARDITTISCWCMMAAI